MRYIVSCVHSQNHQDAQGENLRQLSPRRVRKHAQGPRQKILCSLGSLAPAPREHWRNLAHRLQASLAGQLALTTTDVSLETVVEKGRRGRKPRPTASSIKADAPVAIDTERVSLEEAREAGAVHVGHQMWEQLGLNQILAAAGLSERACRLSEA